MVYIIKFLDGSIREFTDLRGADLRDADLEGVDLSYADLRNADLRDADLSSADLEGVDLSYADLRNADLSYAYLRDADLRNADLRDACLSDADLESATIQPPKQYQKYLKQKTAIMYKVVRKDNLQGATYGSLIYELGKTIIEENLDSDLRNTCSRGINVATKQWCLYNYDVKHDPNLMLIKLKVYLDDICIPHATDGKFRVSKVKVLEHNCEVRN